MLRRPFVSDAGSCAGDLFGCMTRGTLAIVRKRIVALKRSGKVGAPV